MKIHDLNENNLPDDILELIEETVLNDVGEYQHNFKVGSHHIGKIKINSKQSTDIHGINFEANGTIAIDGKTYDFEIKCTDGPSTLRRFELIESSDTKERHKCTCPTYILFRSGCECGGI